MLMFCYKTSVSVSLIHDEIMPDWGHYDFVVGIDAGPVIYSTVINLLEKYRLH